MTLHSSSPAMIVSNGHVVVKQSNNLRDDAFLMNVRLAQSRSIGYSHVGLFTIKD